MVRAWTIAVFALAALLPGGLAQAQGIIEQAPPAKAQPPVKAQAPAKVPGGKAQPPAKKQAGEGPAQPGGSSPQQDAAQTPEQQLLQSVADVAARNFIEEHPVCAAYFAVTAACFGQSDPERLMRVENARTLLQRAVGFEKQYRLKAGSMMSRAEESQKEMAAKVWSCASTDLVLGDFKIPCQALLDDSEARMRQLMLEAAEQAGQELKDVQAAEALKAQQGQQVQPGGQAPQLPPKQ